jgi:hypothetical protein
LWSPHFYFSGSSILDRYQHHMNILVLIMGLTLASLGLVKRKQQHKDWQHFFIGGCVMTVLVIFADIFFSGL